MSKPEGHHNHVEEVVGDANVEPESIRGIASDEDESNDTPESPLKPLARRKAFLAWLVLSFSTGPSGAMANSYLPIVIQSIAHVLGHKPGSTAKCARSRSAECSVRFGSGEIDYNSYVLYLTAISRACEGVLTIALSGFADVANFRKVMMVTCIVFFGLFGTPWAGLTERSYSFLTGASILFAAMNSFQGAYQALEFSYIPLFMKAHALDSKSRSSGTIAAIMKDGSGNEPTGSKVSLVEGSKVSVLGLVVSNVGAILGLLIGVVITYATHASVTYGYDNFLIAITVCGAITVCLGLLGGFMLPSVSAASRGTSIVLLPFQNWYRLFSQLPKYPEPLKFVIGWILWNTGWSNQVGLISLLFRQVLGFGPSNGKYTTWSLTSVIFALLGSLAWMFAFRHAKLGLKTWAYVLLLIQVVCVVWGCIGINKRSPVGFKHEAEFWVEQVLFMSTSSALRALNRVAYSAVIPDGAEGLFTGLQLTLDIATGWINPLVQGVIQDRTHELRFPMIPNVLLIVVGSGFYWWFNLEKGMREAKRAFV